MWRFDGLGSVAGLAHGVSTREGGVSAGAFASLNLGRRTSDAPESVEENRRRVADALGFRRFVGPRQVHGARVVEVHTSDDEPGDADGVMTDREGVLLGVLGADCPGVLLVDERHHALALVHAGWRGVAASIVPRAVEAMRTAYGTRPGDLRAAIGPGIGQAAYEVGPEVADALRAAAPRAPLALKPGRDDRVFADLGRVIAAQLEASGVAPEAVERSPHCTYRDAALFFSHRRDAERAGRHALLAGWQP
jgi:YfiH family protein